jgi:hypothetical protein
MTVTLTETDLASRWCMSIKTLQRWRMQQTGPEYLKLGKQVRYPLEAVAEYEILLYLEQAGQATIEQIQGACLGGKKSLNQIHTHIYRLTRATPPKIKASLVCLDPDSTVMTTLYSICQDYEQ